MIMASILLVDDDSSVLFTSALALRRCGHEVTSVSDGTQALEQLYQQTFDFVISDIRMPGISGLELAKRIQKLPQAPLVILVSAHYDEKVQPNPAAIADAFLQKPLDIDVLCEVLESKSHTDFTLSPALLHVADRGLKERV